VVLAHAAVLALVLGEVVALEERITGNLLVVCRLA
jgi:hypothetical protein